MDTATHFAFGFGLAGLSFVDPAVASDSATALAVMIGTVAGSQAPDSDTLIRFRGNELYVRHHRGMSHSIPAWFVWTGLIAGALKLAFPAVPLGTLVLWVFVAVVLHVGTDIFNTYGTQAFRPVTRRWIAWHIIHIFDPFILGSHAIALGLWAIGAVSPAALFPGLYAILAVYYGWRSFVHWKAERSLPSLDPTHRDGDAYTAIPTVNWGVWNIVRKNREGNYAIGTLRRGRLRWTDEYVCQSSPLIEASKKHPAVAAFLSFSSHPCPQEEKRGSCTVVRWVDARYQHRKQYPFLAVVKYNANKEPVFSYVGWISEEKLEQKLRDAPPHSLPSAAGR